MKTRFVFIFWCIVIFVCIGCMKTVPSDLFTPPPGHFAAQKASELAPLSALAIELDRLAKLGGVPVAPFINVSPSAIEIENWDKDSEWFDQNVIIMEADLDPDAVFSQRMLVESTDRMGRIDLRDDRIVYQLRTSGPEEAATIANMFGKYLVQRNIKRLSPSEKDNFKKFLKEYQRECGLTPDGIFGPKTAACLGRETSVVDIHGLTSKIVYPATPRHAAYVVPLAVVDKAPQAFYKGFDSLETVKQHAVEPKTFGDMAAQGTRFVAFVYFFDRVDPHRPLCLRIGDYQKKSSGTAGQQWHAAPGKWPVVVETFTIDKASKGSLYLNIFIKDGRSNRCISSHRLQ